MNRPQVSVVMAVYNGESFVRQAVESVLDQEFRDLELVVVNDGSTDRTPEILSTVRDRRLEVVTNSSNLGLARALNIGLAAARGKYIARQDADDVSLPARLGCQVAFLEAHPEVGLLGTGVVVIDTRGRALAEQRPPTSEAVLRARLARGNCFVHGSVMFRRACLEKVGCYRDLPTCQDYDLWLRIAEHFAVASLPEVLYQWRLNPAGLSVRNAALQLAYIALVQRLAAERRRDGKDSFNPGLRPTVPSSPWGLAIKPAALPYLVLAGRFLAFGSPLRAVRFGLRGLAADPWNPRLWSLVLTRMVRGGQRATRRSAGEEASVR